MTTLTGTCYQTIDRTQRGYRLTFAWTADGDGDVRHRFEMPLDTSSDPTVGLYVSTITAMPVSIAASYNLYLLDEHEGDLLGGDGQTTSNTTTVRRNVSATAGSFAELRSFVEGERYEFRVDAQADESGVTIIELMYARDNE